MHILFTTLALEPALWQGQYAFGWGSALAGLAGALHALNFGYLQPAFFSYELMVILLLGVVVGGRRSQWGAFVGALAIAMLPNLLSNRTFFLFLAASGCLIALVPVVRSLLTRKAPPFTAFAPALALLVTLALALFLFAMVVGLPDGLAVAVGKTLRRLIKFSQEKLPPATEVLKPLPSTSGIALQVTNYNPFQDLPLLKLSWFVSKTVTQRKHEYYALKWLTATSVFSKLHEHLLPDHVCSCLTNQPQACLCLIYHVLLNL